MPLRSSFSRIIIIIPLPLLLSSIKYYFAEWVGPYAGILTNGNKFSGSILTFSVAVIFSSSIETSSFKSHLSH